MRVALIGDVHANLPALEAVLAHAAAQELETVWNVGDFVGYGPFPDEVVQLLRKRSDTLSILGNYDRQVLQFKEKQEKWRKNKPAAQYTALEFAYRNLSKKNRKYLSFLSLQVRLKSKGKRILLMHGSPESDDGFLTLDTPDEHLKVLGKMAKAAIVIVGHSHQPFVRKVDDVWFINAGSVGRPGDGDPRASYAVLQVEPGGIQVQHHRVEYDVERTASAIRQYGLPEAFAQMFLKGRDLEVVEPGAEEDE